MEMCMRETGALEPSTALGGIAPAKARSMWASGKAILRTVLDTLTSRLGCVGSHTRTHHDGGRAGTGTFKEASGLKWDGVWYEGRVCYRGDDRPPTPPGHVSKIESKVGPGNCVGFRVRVRRFGLTRCCRVCMLLMLFWQIVQVDSDDMVQHNLPAMNIR